MKKTLKGYISGFITAAILVGTIAFAAPSTTTLHNVMSGGIKVVVNGKKINPTDAKGKTVEPIIYNGTTYLPVRAIADALHMPVSWDGPNFTAYLGDCDGKLEYPTAYLTDLTNISQNNYSMVSGNDLVDNYGNRYSDVIQVKYNSSELEYLLDMKYSRFKATLYRPKGAINGSRYIKIVADGKTVYTSPELDKTSRPVDIDVNITGCNDFRIIFYTTYDNGVTTLANAGFYQ